MTNSRAFDELRDLLNKPSNGSETLLLVELLPPSADELWPTRKAISMLGVDGAPDWLGYESALWQLSEQFRPVLVKQRKLRGKGPLCDAISSICANRRYGKGRQNFTLILGEFGGHDYCRELALLLEDQEVEGHAIEALAKAKCWEAVEAVKRSAENTRFAWVRSAARKYMERAASNLR